MGWMLLLGLLVAAAIIVIIIKAVSTRKKQEAQEEPEVSEAQKALERELQARADQGDSDAILELDKIGKIKEIQEAYRMVQVSESEIEKYKAIVQAIEAQNGKKPHHRNLGRLVSGKAQLSYANSQLAVAENKLLELCRANPKLYKSALAE